MTDLNVLIHPLLREGVQITFLEIAMTTQHTTNWPELAEGLFERLTGRHAEITYEFTDMQVKVPSQTGPEAEHAEWVLNGTMKIRTSESVPVPN